MKKNNIEKKIQKKLKKKKLIKKKILKKNYLFEIIHFTITIRN